MRVIETRRDRRETPVCRRCIPRQGVRMRGSAPWLQGSGNGPRTPKHIPPLSKIADPAVTRGARSARARSWTPIGDRDDHRPNRRPGAARPSCRGAVSTGFVVRPRSGHHLDPRRTRGELWPGRWRRRCKQPGPPLFHHGRNRRQPPASTSSAAISGAFVLGWLDRPLGPQPACCFTHHARPLFVISSLARRPRLSWDF